MRVMGLDYGSKTVGVAICDPLGITAQGIETIERKEEYRTHGKTISDKWGKNLEETLEIAKINWIED